MICKYSMIVSLQNARISGAMHLTGYDIDHVLKSFARRSHHILPGTIQCRINDP